MDVKKRIKKMHTYKRTKEKNQSNGDKINRKQKRRNKTTRQMSEIDAQSVHIIGK